MIILLLFGLSILLLKLPFIGKFFKVLNTVIHESGHALMALFFGGKVVKISLFTDTSGSAVTSSKNKFASFFVSLAGYPFSSFISFLLLYFYVNDKLSWIFYVLVVFSIVNLLLWVRNLYGFIWLFGFISLLSLLFFYNIRFENYILLFFIIVLYTEALFSSFVILKLSYKSPKSAGDATNLSKTTKIPAIFWGVFFFSQSIYFAFLGLRLLI